MQFFNQQQIAQTLNYPLLIKALAQAFQQANITTPLRHHHDFYSPIDKVDNTLLLMPAWQEGQFLGIKIITVVPKNAIRNMPTIQGGYFLYNAETGQALAQLDARELTNRRTAATSALACDYLAKPDAKTLLMIGTGALAPYLIEAHRSVRSIEKVLIWGRNFAKAKRLAETLSKESKQHYIAVEHLKIAVKEADIISCATTAETPILKGNWLQYGQHIDLVGSYKKNMREVDNAAIKRVNIYVDTEAAMLESGDLYSPLQEGIISKTAILGDLFKMSQSPPPLQRDAETITLFKSVGHALEDLVAARLTYLARISQFETN